MRGNVGLSELPIGYNLLKYETKKKNIAQKVN